MNKNDLIDAIGEVDDRHIEKLKRKRGTPRRRLAVRLLAAALALAVGIGGFTLWRQYRSALPPDDTLRIPNGVNRLAKPTYPQREGYSKGNYDAWRSQRLELTLNMEEVGAFRKYLEAAIPAFLSDRDGENAVCSPMDVYIGLAMLTETAGGETRQQLLELLGMDSVEDVRALTKRAWNAFYLDDGVSKLEFATSVWLREGMTFDKGVLNTLSKDYYVSAFSGEMGSPELNEALRNWINAHTGNMLTEEVGSLTLTPDTAMALVSTVYYKDTWYFDKALTEKGMFHSPGGDTQADFMHQTYDGSYYWGDKYGAVIKYFENSQMLLILPDEGVTPEELLNDPQALAMLCGERDSDRSGEYQIVLTLPRFDIKSDRSLDDALKSLGITDAFDANAADFSPLNATREDGTPAQLYLSRAVHGARVKVDEEGGEGAAYTMVFLGDGSAPPPEDTDEIVITFDRPFLFAILQNGLPVFTGIVNRP